MSSYRKKPRKMTECQIIAAGVERSNTPEPWRTAMLNECATARRYSAVRVALAVQQMLADKRAVDALIEYSRAVRRGPRGRRPTI